MIKNQKGAITLLVSSFILMASLIFSLGSYKHIFYQIKRAQNEVEARKGYWAAEGGVECAFTKVSTIGAVPSTPIPECASLDLTDLQITQGMNYQIKADKLSQIVKKDFTIGGSGGDGAIQSASNLYFYSSITFTSPDPVKLGTDGWECVAVRYKDKIGAFGSVNNAGVNHSVKPSSDFDNQGKDCSPEHKTNSAAGSSNFKSDFLRDDKISPFKDLFGIEPSDHNTIRDNGKFDILYGSGSGGDKRLSECGTKLKNRINAGEEYIWVEGSCEITSAQYEGFSEVMNNSLNGAFIVIHDGSLSIMGAPPGTTAKDMKGVIFHFNHDYSVPTDGSNWYGTDAYSKLYPHGGTPSSLYPSEFLTTASFYQHGAFTLLGGQFFDTKDQSAIFYTSSNFKYNSDIVNKLVSGLVQPRWVKGSWHDF
ncbi:MULTISPECIES: hypothetical protein [unclassified Aliivibrio]|uniref:hypothetical protein n=1 Tax=unclassified Aliivibrio TaxID=2645654 RepID=UPI00080ED4B3|nr:MULTISPECIES: hypothetical protein [unclassified Aliivibrio]OCH14933.1 hypothetical protein A6E03_16110 [Aliivibrio sp. 1S128]OCH16178.1 hypothetical protein A6E05_16790 [Aliivibrio sp. 1S165]OCH33874.1 hypothetical protein A6E06_17735 [Aliivibrio sp. 1S175]